MNLKAKIPMKPPRRSEMQEKQASVSKEGVGNHPHELIQMLSGMTLAIIKNIQQFSSSHRKDRECRQWEQEHGRHVISKQQGAYLRRKAFLVDHLRAHGGPGLLVEFVDGGADGAELGRRYAADTQHGVQDSPVVELDAEGTDVQLRQNLHHHLFRQEMRKRSTLGARWPKRIPAFIGSSPGARRGEGFVDQSIAP